MNNTKDLLKALRRWERKSLKSGLFEKLKGAPEAGARVLIRWNGPYLAEIEDRGYCFALPEYDEQSYHFIVHVPKPENPGGIGDGDPEFWHLYDLLENGNVKSITVVPQTETKKI